MLELGFLAAHKLGDELDSRRRSDECVSISARSLGKINVQIVMEALEGGGHLTNAATQLQNILLEDAVEKLKQVIYEYLEGGEK